MNRFLVSLPTMLLTFASLTAAANGQQPSAFPSPDDTQGSPTAVQVDADGGKSDTAKSDALASDGAAAVAEATPPEPTPQPRTTERRPVRRLPRYFASVVDSRQRAEIYRIQGVYWEQIVQLEHQLQTLREAESQAIEKVLSPEQLSAIQAKQIDAARQSQLRRSQAANEQAAPANSSSSAAQVPTAATAN